MQLRQLGWVGSHLGWVALCIASAVGCGNRGSDVREWRASDHQKPEEPAALVPSGSNAGDPREGDPEEAAQPTGDTRSRAAAALFSIHCASCHGVEGRGDGPAVPPSAQVPDMTDPKWQSSRTDEQLSHAIAKGKGMMPAFGTRLNADGIEALVQYVRSRPRDSGEGQSKDTGSKGR